MIRKKRIVISGAGGYLGSHLCFLFSELNYDLICLEIDKKRLGSLKKKLKHFKNQKKYFLTDITNEKKLISISKQLSDQKLLVDVIINNASNNPPVKKTKKIELMQTKSWKDDVDVGLMGAFIVTKSFITNLKKGEGGSIINIGSDLSILSPNHEIYKFKNMSFLKPVSYPVIKHGLVGLNKYFATLYGSKKIISNMISPGPIDHNLPSYLRKRLIANTPMKKLCSVEEIFKTILFLCDTKNRHITGQNIVIDGGKSLI